MRVGERPEDVERPLRAPKGVGVMVLVGQRTVSTFRNVSDDLAVARLVAVCPVDIVGPSPTEDRVIQVRVEFYLLIVGPTLYTDPA